MNEVVASPLQTSPRLEDFPSIGSMGMLPNTLIFREAAKRKEVNT
jgi:hypothetical protein